MSDTYILQVDLPDGSMRGDEYQQFGQSGYFSNVTRRYGNQWQKSDVENNPTFFKKKEHYAEIIKIHSNRKYVIEYHVANEAFHSTLDAIEGLNIFEAVRGYSYFTFPEKSFTQQDIDDARKESFEAARIHKQDLYRWVWEYTQFEDYLKSINK